MSAPARQMTTWFRILAAVLAAAFTGTAMAQPTPLEITNDTVARLQKVAIDTSETIRVQSTTTIKTIERLAAAGAGPETIYHIYLESRRDLVRHGRHGTQLVNRITSATVSTLTRMGAPPKLVEQVLTASTAARSQIAANQSEALEAVKKAAIAAMGG